MYKRSILFSVVVLLSAGFVACGGSDNDKGNNTPSVAHLFPANEAIATWVEDTTAYGSNGQRNPAGVEVANNLIDAGKAVNGDAEIFDKHGFVAMGREFYTNGTAKFELQIWQMPSATATADLYTQILLESDFYRGVVWTTIDDLGDQARGVNAGTYYWYNVQKAAYFIDLRGLKPLTEEALVAGESFLRTVVDGM